MASGVTTAAGPVLGPAWSNKASRVVQGRFPLGVERFIMAKVNDLVPGVTTVTLNARYYALHGYVAHTGQRDGITDSELITRLRRAEVVLGAVSAHHLNVDPDAHRAYSQPHGYNKIVSALRRDGAVNVEALSARGAYATARQGFLAAYRGSEMLLDVLAPGARLRPGENCDGTALTEALGDLDGLVGRPSLTEADLEAHVDLCLCRMSAPTATDGAWLSRTFAAPDCDRPSDRRRRQTLQMIHRAVTLTEIDGMTRDLSRFICYSDQAHDDPVLARLPLVQDWRGLMLRNQSTSAWRRLWAWLVDAVDALSTRRLVADRLADELPSGTVQQWLSQLPPTATPSGRVTHAERLPELDGTEHDVERWLAVLALGARRSGELRGREFDGFTNRVPTDVHEELAPAWLAQQLTNWTERSLRDFARHLTQVLVNRSQRLALAKARPNPRTGVLEMPTRLLTRDEYLFTQGREGRGPASLRLDQLAQILAGMGLLDRVGDQWTPGTRSDLLED
ncbi:hypothetical protein [Geodermatophilus sp. URMC 65]